MKQAVYVSHNNESSIDGIARLNISELTHSLLAEVGCLLVDGRNEQKAIEIIAEIRLNDSPNIYLLPIYLVTDANQLSQLVKSSADGQISKEHLPDNLSNIMSSVTPINHWISQLGKNKTIQIDSLPLRVIRLMASRNLTLAPLTTTVISDGFLYPLIQPLFHNQDTSALFVLNRLASQYLLGSEQVNRAHFCNHCDSAFLNFKETCAQCQSEMLLEEELIHHFHCSYTAEKSKFRQEDNQLQCPKCDKRLKHIGVDYDKPSTIYRCQSCQYTSQSTHVTAQCFNCSRSSDPEYLTKRDIFQYSLSSIGMNAAIFGLDTFFTNILEHDLHLISHQEFQRFIQIEAARIKRYKRSESSLVLLRFENIETLYEQLGMRAQDVLTEISQLFKGILRETDLITAYNESLFSLILVETSKSNSNIALERLDSSLQSVITASLDRSIQLNYKVCSLADEIDYQSALDAFLIDIAK